MPETTLKLDWATAEIADGDLTLTVEGSGPSGWEESFERSVRLLHGGSGDWGEVTVSDETVKVAAVAPGSEEKLHHFLEGVMQQVNADHEEPEEQSEDRDGDSQHDDGPDAQMAERFRSFAEPDTKEPEDS